MAKLSILGMSTVLGYAFWWAANALGASFFTSFVISGVGSLVGCWVGWKLYQRYFN